MKPIGGLREPISGPKHPDTGGLKCDPDPFPVGFGGGWNG
jgi:hypothetical protein